MYVHIPFCTTRCGYCDFNTYTADELGNGVSRSTWADTLLGEIRLARDVLGTQVPPVSTVFFGGGTPTLLPAEHLGIVLREIAETFGVVADPEITTEANPESVAPAYLESLRAQGFTRISVGMQSAVPRVLEVLDRRHRPGRPEQVVAEARAAGFEHVSLDLIYGAPYETDADWQASLDAAIGSGADHVSAYALVVEDGTALARQVARGIVPAPDDDALADRYVMADETLQRGRVRVVRGVQLGPHSGRSLPAQRALLGGRELVGDRPRGAQPRRRRALVERQAPGALRRPARPRRQPGRRSRDAHRRSPARPRR